MSEHTSDYMSNNGCEKNVFKNILHNIRNMKLLSKEDINAIRKMSDHQKMEIIMIYDCVMENMNDVMNNVVQ